MPDHIKALVAALERAEPCIAGIGMGPAEQHGEAFAAVLAGRAEIAAVKPGLAYQCGRDRFHAVPEEVEKMGLQGLIDIRGGDVVDNGLLESCVHSGTPVIKEMT